MADNTQLGLREPDPMDWDNYNPSTSFKRPPVPYNGDGMYKTYYGQAPTEFKLDVTKEGYRSFVIDPITLVKNGLDVDGYQLRFTRASVKKFMNRKTGEPIDASMAGNYLRACGVQQKPQRNKEYEAAVNATRGKVFPFTIEWTAYNKDTGERIDGYKNFPDDPERPGEKKAILHAGDTYTVTDRDGTVLSTETVKADVMFANARLRFFVDPSRNK